MLRLTFMSKGFKGDPWWCTAYLHGKFICYSQGVDREMAERNCRDAMKRLEGDIAEALATDEAERVTMNGDHWIPNEKTPPSPMRTCD